MEVRVSALEARWDETVPTLATIADLRGVENRLIKWVLGAAVGLLLALIGIMSTTNSRFDQLNSRIDLVAAELRADTRAAIADLKDETRTSIADLRDTTAELKAELRDTNARMEARFEKIDTRFEKMDMKFDALLEELRSQRSTAR